jgi:hypothetical protein
VSAAFAETEDERSAPEGVPGHISFLGRVDGFHQHQPARKADDGSSGIRSERQLMEQLNYNLLYGWFVGLSPDDPAWDPTTFTKNRERLQVGDVRLNDVLLTLPLRCLMSTTLDGAGAFSLTPDGARCYIVPDISKEQINVNLPPSPPADVHV